MASKVAVPKANIVDPAFEFINIPFLSPAQAFQPRELDFAQQLWIGNQGTDGMFPLQTIAPLGISADSI